MKCRNKFIISIVFVLLIIILNSIFNIKRYSVVKISAENDFSISKGYGIVYKKNKYTYIMTNYHIINNKRKIYIYYGDKKVKATIVNGDEYEDIAVLKVNNDDKLIPEIFKTKVSGSRVWIDYNKRRKIGVLKGINQKKKVKLSDGYYLLNLIKLDLTTYYGYSGLPLYEGRNIIGVITLQDNRYSYAIDIDHALIIANKLEKGNIKRRELGATMASTSNKEVLKQYRLDNQDLEGVIVVNASKMSQLKKGDIIVKINNYRIKDIVHFKYYLFNVNQYILLVYRNGKYIKIKG